jgi:hypothetical protein
VGGFRKICGKSLVGNEITQWTYFGGLWRNWFLPFTKHFLRNVDKLEALVNAIENSAKIFGRA